MRRKLLYLLGGAVALVACAAAAGWLLPVRHRAARTVVYEAAPDVVFAAIADVADYPSWRTGVERVELLEQRNGKPRFREDGEHGPIAYSVEVCRPDERLVTRIDDPSLPFGGTWTFELARAGAGTSLTITEDGEIYNPLFRLLSKLFFPADATITAYQADLERRLRAPARPARPGVCG